MMLPKAFEGGFFKFDFHIHTPVSQCHEDNMYPELKHHTTPEEIVQAALTARLHAMVITDHNSAANVAPIQAAARGTGLVIFPGLEITTAGGHLLCVFDPDTPVNHVERLLDTLDFPDPERGNPWYTTQLWLDECAEKVVEWGGLPVAAHVDREPRGYMAGDIPLDIKKRIHQSPHLAALEITDPRNRKILPEGSHRHYTKPYPVVQGSDAHASREIGRRSTFLRFSRLDLEGLKHVFREHPDRIRFPWELENGVGH
ncbi:MAG: PHP domain-containing protein [Chloroflexi bacterium]|nr:PHP domain-containing protein [Chloroflexota bacterium]